MPVVRGVNNREINKPLPKMPGSCHWFMGTARVITLLVLAVGAGVSAYGFRGGLHWLLPSAQALSLESVLYLEGNGIGGYSQSLSGGGDGDGGILLQKDTSLRNSLGLEYLGKLSNDYGDFLTANVQLRLGYGLPGPAVVDELHNFQPIFEVHGAWVDWKLGWGKYLRVGRFAPSFGLESVYDSHATIFQTMAHDYLGFKKDWGVGYRTMLGPFDLSMAGQLGSGMGVAWEDNNFLFSSRMATPPGTDFQYGISLMLGRTLTSHQMSIIPYPEYGEEAIFRRQAGFDWSYRYGPWLTLGELVTGKVDDDWGGGGLVQVEYTVPSLQALSFGVQGRLWSEGWQTPFPEAVDGVDEAEAGAGNGDGATDLENNHGSRITSSLGLQAAWSFNESLLARVAASQDFTIKPGELDDTKIFLQLYWLGRLL